MTCFLVLAKNFNILWANMVLKWCVWNIFMYKLKPCVWRGSEVSVTTGHTYVLRGNFCIKNLVFTDSCFTNDALVPIFNIKLKVWKQKLPSPSFYIKTTQYSQILSTPKRKEAFEQEKCTKFILNWETNHNIIFINLLEE